MSVANFDKLVENSSEVDILYAHGMSPKKIGLKFGVSRSGVVKFLTTRGKHIRVKNTEFKSRVERRLADADFSQMCESSIRRWMKRMLILKFGYKCSICHITEWCGQPAPLICDHIDGNTRNSCESNFRLVCANCDAQLPTYKNKNRGQGRNNFKKMPQ